MREKVNKATVFYAARLNKPFSTQLKIREMEYIEHSSFIEMYWSLVSLPHFMTFTIF